MADETQPQGNQTADRLASLLRGGTADHVMPSGAPAEELSEVAQRHTDPATRPQAALLRASQAEADQHASVPPAVPIRRSGKRATVKKLANPKPSGRPGVMRRPSWGDESPGSEPSYEPSDSGTPRSAQPLHEVDPSQLPPPQQRTGLRVATRIEEAHTPTEVFAGQTRQAKKGRERRQSKKESAAGNPHSFEFGQPSSSQILDLRVPGKVKGDSPFLAPLLPSMFVAVLGTYLWFQASIRLESYLPLAPILLGVTVGGIMRLGTKSVDFARVIFAVLITAFATFWGHAATKDFGPLGRLTADQILWSDLPRVANPVGLISTFHATAEASLARATLMFAGLLAAGLLASLTPK